MDRSRPFDPGYLGSVDMVSLPDGDMAEGDLLGEDDAALDVVVDAHFSEIACSQIRLSSGARANCRR